MYRVYFRATVVGLTLVIASFGVARATEPGRGDVNLVSPPTPAERIQLRLVRAEYDQRVAHQMKIAGMVLSILGTVSLATTLIGAGLVAGTSPTWGDNNRDNPPHIAGAFMVMFGGFFTLVELGPGLPLWLVGSARERTLERAHLNFSLAPCLNGGQLSGGTAQLSFSF